MVFAHGLGGNHLSWWQQVAHLSARRTCVVFAHRGFPPSSPVPGARAPDSYADDLAALIRELQLDDVALVAQSMGGWTCLEYALRNAAKVRALVMASTSGRLDFAQLKDNEVGAWSACAGRAGRHAAARHPSRRRRAHGARAAGPRPTLLADLRACAGFVSRRRPQKIRDQRSQSPSALAQLPMPVLFITGDEDWVFPPAAGPALRSSRRREAQCGFRPPGIRCTSSARRSSMTVIGRIV